METRFEFRDFLKVFSLALILFLVFAGILSRTPGIEQFLSTLHPSISFLVEYLVQFVILFCPLWIFVVGKYNATPEDFGFKKVAPGKVLKTVLFYYAAYLVFTVLLSSVLGATGLSVPGYESQESYIPLFGSDLAGLVIGFVLVGVLAPVLEEVLFRGFVYRVFVKIWPVWLGSILSAVLFAMIHMQFQSFIPLFILGLLLNRCYEKNDSLWTSIAFHGFNNILAFAVEVYLSFHPEFLERLAALPHFLYTVQIG